MQTCNKNIYNTAHMLTHTSGPGMCTGSRKDRHWIKTAGGQSGGAGATRVQDREHKGTDGTLISLLDRRTSTEKRKPDTAEWRAQDFHRSLPHLAGCLTPGARRSPALGWGGAGAARTLPGGPGTPASELGSKQTRDSGHLGLQAEGRLSGEVGATGHVGRPNAPHP